MNDKTGGNRSLRRAGALAAVAAVAVLAAACGGSAPPSQSAPTYVQVLALAKCMRSHGVPNFPDPDASGGYSLTANGSLTGAGGSSVDINSSQAQAAYGDCRHLLPGGPSISQLEQDEQQEQQQQAKMLPVLLKYVHCMRSHDVPNFPAPGQSKFGSGGPPNVSSPQYLAAASACQHLLPRGDKVSISTGQSRSSS
ncbi:MAG: hypothetical protein WB800_44400 [Streptosporangiaceae bacterium]